LLRVVAAAALTESAAVQSLTADAH
jgi:hypothetical protein